ncbi:MAG: FtsX-like permease family protein, partial [Saprospiraceae bacterium]|nr:FtsX-like permease family protein [Saprospiraceae bacterium]
QGKRRAGNWNSSFLNVFVKLRDGSGLASDEKALLRFREKYYPGQENEIREAGNWTGEGPPVTYRLQPMSAVHTETHVSSANVPAIDPKSIWTLLLISTGVLLIAIINFTTLSIGRSSSRSKEVGIRKVIGGSRMQLGVQFLTESVLLSIISVVIGLAIVQIVMPFFSSLSGREMILSYQDFPEIFWLVGLLTLIAGLLAGAYPAFMLSRFKPVGVLKNDLKLGGFNWFTKSLVTSQFVLSAGLVIATIIAWSQLDLMRSQSPGFNKENVIVVDANAIDTDKVYPLFKDALANDPNILGVASSDLGLGANMGWSRSGFDYEGELKQVYEYFVDDDYIGVMGLELLAGRDFNSDRQDGLNLSVIINESMAQDFEWTISDAIGKELLGYNNEGLNPKVVGVVKDFNFRSLKEEVLPQMFHTFEDYAPYKFFIRIRPGDPSLAIDNLQKTWSNLVPAYPLQYSFLDDDVNRFYRAEGRFSKIIGWAGGMSIFLSCLGLLGLVGLASLNRTKEIGIRKVLGASIPNIIGLLSKDFLKLILIALVIASPVTWYLMNSWLKDFAYRIDIQWWVFVFAGFIAIGVALITVGYQSIKAAMANPIDSLRDE